ncbi:hypothetical protein V1527DRAFT_455710 [Lipomyces starkeyi]
MVKAIVNGHMYMEALFMHKGTSDMISGMGIYNTLNVEDAAVIVRKNNAALLDLIVILGNQEPGLLATKDAEHFWNYAPGSPNLEAGGHGWADQVKKEYVRAAVNQSFTDVASYLDSRATSHVCKDPKLFETYVPFTTPQTIPFAGRHSGLVYGYAVVAFYWYLMVTRTTLHQHQGTPCTSTSKF